MPGANVDTIERAIRYAEEKHKDQKRKDGSPYIIHPLAVAEVVLEMGLELATGKDVIVCSIKMTRAAQQAAAAAAAAAE